MNNDVVIIDKEKTLDKIYIIRGYKVMLDSDLAQIYGYTTKAFNQQVKKNMQKFDDDFMFRLTDEETKDILRSKKLTSSWGGVRYNPYAFTEQGIYMLMTVLKGELATKQSKALIRIFKEMKDYIVNASESLSKDDIIKLSIQVNQNTREIKEIKENMVTKSDLAVIIKQFLPHNQNKELLLLNGQTVEANIAYKDIYGQANKRVYVIDNYISLKTLILLKDINDLEVTIFSDNIHNGLTKLEYDEFINEYPQTKINFIKTNKVFHDRYIIIDYDSNSEKIYHCGASSKDAGKRINTITEIKDISAYKVLIDNILNNDKLILK